MLAAVGVLNAQPQFEVASIKPNPPGGVSTGMVRFLPGGRLSAQQVRTGLLGAVLTMTIGYIGTWRALGARPAAYLANE